MNPSELADWIEAGLRDREDGTVRLVGHNDADGKRRYVLREEGGAAFTLTIGHRAALNADTAEVVEVLTRSNWWGAVNERSSARVVTFVSGVALVPDAGRIWTDADGVTWEVMPVSPWAFIAGGIPDAPEPAIIFRSDRGAFSYLPPAGVDPHQMSGAELQAIVDAKAPSGGH